ncbi:hypothetical protein D8S78_23445 [Natrialba swarupiae]|nr:hypothetical protein [Natrialba swarupiae]
MMKSSGGVATPKMIQQSPVQIIESGPVAGALNAAHIGEHVGHENVSTWVGRRRRSALSSTANPNERTSSKSTRPR